MIVVMDEVVGNSTFQSDCIKILQQNEEKTNEINFYEKWYSLEEDHIFKYENTEIVIDDMSLSFLEGSKLEFVDDLSGSFFQVVNPNASSSCGCGTSFSI